MPCLWGHTMLHSVLNHVPVPPFLCFDCCSSPWTHVSDMFHYDHHHVSLKIMTPKNTWLLKHMTSKVTWLHVTLLTYNLKSFFIYDYFWQVHHTAIWLLRIASVHMTIMDFVSSIGFLIWNIVNEKLIIHGSLFSFLSPGQDKIFCGSLWLESIWIWARVQLGETLTGVGSGIIPGLGLGRSSKKSEAVSSTDENLFLVGQNRIRSYNQKMLEWSWKVTLLSAQLINRLCRISQSSPRIAGNLIFRLVIKNLTWWRVLQENWTEISVAHIIYDGKGLSMRQSLIQGIKTIGKWLTFAKWESIKQCNEPQLIIQEKISLENIRK